MSSKTPNEKLQLQKQTRRVYVKPDIKEVWNENIGMTGVYLLEM